MAVDRRIIALFLGLLSGLGLKPALASGPAMTDSSQLAGQMVRTFVEGDDVSSGDHVNAAKQAMMTDPEQALRHAQSAETLARRATGSPRQKQDIATAFWLQAEALGRLNRYDEASPLIERAIILVGNRKSEERLGGELMLTRGRIAKAKGDIEEALKSYQEAHEIFAALKEPRSQAIALQSIGSIYNDARNYERVVEYYKRSAAVYSDAPLDLSANNNLGNAYKEMGEYDNAVAHYQTALKVAEQLDSPMLQARILTNIASVQVRSGLLDEAQKAVNRGLELTADDEFQAWRPFLYGVQAQIDWAWGKNEPARTNLERLFEGQDLAYTTMAYLEFHEAAYHIYKSVGDLELALKHLEAFKRLDEIALNAAASANVALMGAEFDFASQQLEIEKLKTGQLQRDIALAQARDRQRFMLTGFVALFGLVLAVALGFGYVSVHRSRNSIRKANEELQLSHQQLQESNLALEKANSAKTEFLATTSHEIRTPLNGILGMTEVLLKNNNLDPGDRERLETVRKAGNALLLIVNDILDVAKIESGRMKVIQGPVNIRDSIRETVELWRENAESKGLNVEADLVGLPDLIEADERYIRQIVFNLLSNAIKFTEAGVISIRGWSQADDSGENFYIEIRDSGIGIPEHELENIFKTFQQVDSGSNRKYGGTGLGLSICRKLARLMKGDLTVASKVGAGSSFTLRLPLVRLASRSVAAPARAETDRSDSLKELDVLVAEDNKVNQIVIESLLKGCVRSVDIVDDGTQVLEALKVKQYDLILMDKQMPGMDGAAAAQAIRASDKPWRDIYIIAVTADAFEGAREDLIAKGMDDYLAKPVSQDALVRVMQTAIDCNFGRAVAARAAAAV